MRTTNVFCAVEPKAGKHFNVATPDRSGPEFVKAVDAIAQHYPAASTIHLVMDNLNIHHRKTFIDYFGPDRGAQMWDRLTVHYTPKHGSWLNQAEIEISLFARQCLGRRRSRISTPFGVRPTPKIRDSTASGSRLIGSLPVRKPA